MSNGICSKSLVHYNIENGKVIKSAKNTIVMHVLILTIYKNC